MSKRSRLMKTHTDFHFRGSLAELDPAVAQLIEYKAERQYLRQRKESPLLLLYPRWRIGPHNL
jgi:hypothetical protein